MNHAEREARNTPRPGLPQVNVHYNGYRCRPNGRPRQKRHVWGANNVCVRCGKARNPEAK